MNGEFGAPAAPNNSAGILAELANSHFRERASTAVLVDLSQSSHASACRGAMYHGAQIVKTHLARTYFVDHLLARRRSASPKWSVE